MPAPPSARAWASLSPPLSPWLLDATAALGLERMTPVQASTIPLFMGHKDVVVEAVTGSGKTLAFLIPVIERLLRLEAPVKKHHVAGIILSPTRCVPPPSSLASGAIPTEHRGRNLANSLLSRRRELATQIYTVLESLLQFHPASAEHRQALQDRENPPSTTAEIIRQSQQAGDGGLPNDAAVAAQQADEAREHRHKHKDKSRKSSRHDLRIVPQLLLGGATSPAQDLSVFLARSPNLLVATPGRLLELLSSPHVHCPQSAFEVLVLDEADRLLDLGFKDDLQRILARLPKQRRTGLFSASVSEAVDQLVHVGLRNPVKIAVKVKSASGALDKMTPASLQMTYLLTTPSQKLPTVANIFRRMAAQQHGPGLPAKSIIYFSTCAAVDYFQHVVPALLPPELGLTTVPLHGKHPPAARAKNFARFVDAATPAVLLTS
ncbi:ATP-dependent rRNA helicase spb4 [Ascosphaera acerosa]|nr:ATP-dependent rRNA helicase spb4 [Ascosphaera acerosa]